MNINDLNLVETISLMYALDAHISDYKARDMGDFIETEEALYARLQDHRGYLMSIGVKNEH